MLPDFMLLWLLGGKAERQREMVSSLDPKEGQWGDLNPKSLKLTTYLPVTSNESVKYHFGLELLKHSNKRTLRKLSLTWFITLIFYYYRKLSICTSYIKIGNVFNLKYSSLPCISMFPVTQCEQMECRKSRHTWCCLCWDSLPDSVQGSNPQMWQHPERRLLLQHSQPGECWKDTCGYRLLFPLGLIYIDVTK